MSSGQLNYSNGEQKRYTDNTSNCPRSKYATLYVTMLHCKFLLLKPFFRQREQAQSFYFSLVYYFVFLAGRFNATKRPLWYAQSDYTKRKTIGFIVIPLQSCDDMQISLQFSVHICCPCQVGIFQKARLYIYTLTF